MHGIITFVFVILFSSVPVLAQVPASMQNKSSAQQQGDTSMNSIDAIKRLLEGGNKVAPQQQVEDQQQNSQIQPAPEGDVYVNKVNSLDKIVNDPNKIESAFDALERKHESDMAKEPEVQPASEIPEGQAAQGEVTTPDANAEQPATAAPAAENKIVVLDQGSDVWIPKLGPKKSEKNLLRVNFKKDSYSLSDADKIAINSMLKIIDEGKTKNVKITSYSSKHGSVKTDREYALLRALKLREYMKQNGYDVDYADYKIVDSSGNKANIDYIDVDKN